MDILLFDDMLVELNIILCLFQNCSDGIELYLFCAYKLYLEE